MKEERNPRRIVMKSLFEWRPWIPAVWAHRMQQLLALLIVLQAQIWFSLVVRVKASQALHTFIVLWRGSSLRGTCICSCQISVWLSTITLVLFFRLCIEPFNIYYVPGIVYLFWIPKHIVIYKFLSRNYPVCHNFW